MKVTNYQPPSSVTMKTTPNKDMKQAFTWWKSKGDLPRCQEFLATASHLKETQAYRYRQAAIYARLYGNMSLFSFIGSNINKLDKMSGLPSDRPTFNVIQSATDTLVSRISQSKPTPVFLTDAGDYKQRSLAKKLNNFIAGEFYQTDAYKVGEYVLRDALVEGTGCIKVFEQDDRVAIERVLLTEILIDANESIYGKPRQMYQVKLMDRDVLKDICPKYKVLVEKAEAAYPENSAESAKTVSDMVMVVEGWHLKSGKNAKDGRHMIACSAGILVDEDFENEKFPFIFLHYSTRLLGFWSQGLAEQLMGTQIEINSLLSTISKAIKLVGVPRVFVETGSKVLSTQFNNDVGAIIKYQGTKPTYEVAPCVPEELYAQLQRLIGYGYQQSGVSSLQASSEKPAGLDSGEAIRTYDDISTDRFAALSKRFDNMYVDLAYAITDCARAIVERTGKYTTLYPNKDGTKEIDFAKLEINEDPFVIQAFNMSSLPRDPAGRMQKVTELMQSGIITLREGRRLLDYPDLQQMERLANASEERIFQTLDNIVEEGKYVPPDSFMDLNLAKELVVSYYNLYAAAKLEEDKQQMLRDWYVQVGALVQQATPPPQPAMAPPQANPQPTPTSPQLPNGANPTGA